MATILKRKTKKGISYRIQVRIKDKVTGKPETKITTWRKPSDMSERESLRNAQKYAIDYEERVRKENQEYVVRENALTVKEFTEIWHDMVYRNRSITYYTSSKYQIAVINERLGKYKLKELTPTIIQRYINDLSNVKKEKVIIKANGLEIRKQELGLSLCKLSKLSGVSKCTIENAINGDNITLDCANRIAKAMDCDVKDIFVVRKELKPMSSSAIARNYRVLRSILAVAKKQCLIEHNYASSDYVTSIKEHRKPIVYLNDEEAKRLSCGLMQEEDIRIKTALLLLLMTGMRRGEVCGLEWKDIDFVNETITVNRSTLEVTGMGLVTKEPKSIKSKRTIILPSSLIKVLRDYREYWEGFTKSIGDRYDGNDRLFLQSTGKPIHPSALRFWLRKITSKLGLRDVNVHSLRHTNITLQIMAGVPLKTVSVRVGHNSTKVTSDIYAHLLTSGDREAANTIDRIFNS